MGSIADALPLKTRFARFRRGVYPGPITPVTEGVRAVETCDTLHYLSSASCHTLPVRRRKVPPYPVVFFLTDYNFFVISDSSTASSYHSIIGPVLKEKSKQGGLRDEYALSCSLISG